MVRARARAYANSGSLSGSIWGFGARPQEPVVKKKRARIPDNEHDFSVKYPSVSFPDSVYKIMKRHPGIRISPTMVNKIIVEHTENERVSRERRERRGW